MARVTVRNIIPPRFSEQEILARPTFRIQLKRRLYLICVSSSTPPDLILKDWLYANRRFLPANP